MGTAYPVLVLGQEPGTLAVLLDESELSVPWDFLGTTGPATCSVFLCFLWKCSRVQIVALGPLTFGKTAHTHSHTHSL